MTIAGLVGWYVTSAVAVSKSSQKLGNWPYAVFAAWIVGCLAFSIFGPRTLPAAAFEVACVFMPSLVAALVQSSPLFALWFVRSKQEPIKFKELTFRAGPPVLAQGANSQAYVAMYRGQKVFVKQPNMDIPRAVLLEV